MSAAVWSVTFPATGEEARMRVEPLHAPAYVARNWLASLGYGGPELVVVTTGDSMLVARRSGRTVAIFVKSGAK